MRFITNLSQDWLFSKSCTSAPAEKPTEESWEAVTLPHTWNAVDGQIGTPFDRGAYWYVTTFTPPKQPIPGGRTYIEVGAASLVGEIWVNGIFQTRHVGGFSAFRADVTEACHEGENVLAILCDNSYSEKVYPQRADFTFYGGLYRYVRVISAPASRFTLDHLGDSGVFVDAVPEGKGAEVKARALLDGIEPGQFVQLELFGPDGEPVGEAWEEAKAETTLTLHLPEAKLWNGPGDAPLYTARLRLVSYNEVVDEVSTTFGIRDFSVDPEKGFLLNGASHPLRGVCRHQDRLYEGNALTREEHFEDARIIADMGANCIRLAHYQQSKDIYDACDELGLVVWAEIPYFATTWDDDAHAAAVNEIREMVAQNYNHPSICFWGLSNEILMMDNDNPKLLPCHEDLNRAVKELDQKRLTVIAHEYNAGWDHPLHDISDAEGWNHYFGWYRGEMEDFGKWLDEYHEKYPQRRISVSEYGCDSLIRYHSDTPVKMDYTEEYQVLIHESACETLAARPFVWGSFVWNMFDFGSYFRKEGGTMGRNNKGLVTMDRKIKKDSYYVYKAWFSPEPFVHVDGRRYFARPGETTAIRVHSNLSPVSLYVDGKLFGTREGAHTFIFENVPLSCEGTTITAAAGEERDTITLRRADEKPEAFTFADFKHAQDAKNWFEGVEDIAGDLTDKPGCYSIHDSVAVVVANEKAKKILMNALTAVSERILAESRVLQGDLTKPLIDFLSTGFIATSLLRNKKDITLRRIHAALSGIPKE